MGAANLLVQLKYPEGKIIKLTLDMQTNTQDYFSKPKKEIMKKLVKHSSTFRIQMMIEFQIFMDSKCDWPCNFSMQPFSDQKLLERY